MKKGLRPETPEGVLRRSIGRQALMKKGLRHAGERGILESMHWETSPDEEGIKTGHSFLNTFF